MSPYLPTAEGLAELRGDHGASGVCLWAPDLSSLPLSHREAFLAQYSFWETVRGQAGLLRQATLLYVASGIQCKAPSLGFFLLFVKEETPQVKKHLQHPKETGVGAEHAGDNYGMPP